MFYVDKFHKKRLGRFIVTTETSSLADSNSQEIMINGKNGENKVLQEKNEQCYVCVSLNS